MTEYVIPNRESTDATADEYLPNETTCLRRYLADAFRSSTSGCAWVNPAESHLVSRSRRACTIGAETQPSHAQVQVDQSGSLRHSPADL